MIPVEPTFTSDNEEGHRVNLAENQPQYMTLPAIVEDDGIVTTEWLPQAWELEYLLKGGAIRLRTLTYGQPFQPVRLDVLDPTMRES